MQQYIHKKFFRSIGHLTVVFLRLCEGHHGAKQGLLSFVGKQGTLCQIKIKRNKHFKTALDRMQI